MVIWQSTDEYTRLVNQFHLDWSVFFVVVLFLRLPHLSQIATQRAELIRKN